MDTILVVNAGSSSLKFELFAVGTALTRLVKGQLESIGTTPHFAAKNAKGEQVVNRSYSSAGVPDLASAMHHVGAWLRDQHEGQLVAIGHRVVHGGPDYARPVRVDQHVLEELERYVPLAPLHQLNNLAPIRMLLERQPGIPQIACFDTAFHRVHDPLTDHYAIPARYFAEGVRRYGFHGLSYEYVAGRLREVAPDIARGPVIVAHLGNGASMCALRDGQSLECTFGFTALDGLPMGTRCGQIDPGVLLYLIEQGGMTPSELQDMLYNESGLKGLSGISNDVRDLLASDDVRAALALDHLVHRISLNAGALAAALGGLEAFVFTAGIGENSPIMRERIAKKLKWLGTQLDPARNESGEMLISTADSQVALYVIPTDEELMIAQHTLGVIT